MLKRRLKVLLCVLAISCGLAIVKHHHTNPRVLKDSVVELVISTGNGGATGFEIKAPSGRVFTLTNKHVCEAQATNAVLEDRIIPLRVIEISDTTDLCLMEGIAGKSGLSLAGYEPEQGDIVYTLGYGMLLGLAETQGEFVGMVPAKVLTVTNPNYTTAPILAGNSGSPAFNEYGEVIGVCYASSDQIDNRAFLVPLQQIEDFLKPY
jgi:serine protease Do